MIEINTQKLVDNIEHVQNFFKQIVCCLSISSFVKQFIQFILYTFGINIKAADLKVVLKEVQLNSCRMWTVVE